MEPIINSRYLVSAGRDIKVPFRLLIKPESGIKDDRNIELICTRVLRIIPGKRLVCSGMFNDNPVVAKIFIKTGNAKRHFARETKGIDAFKKNGILTPPLILKGKLESDNLPVMVFKRIIPAQDLFEACKKNDDYEKCFYLLKKVVAVIACQHNAGIKQDDPHPGNFLLSGDDIYTIDGSSVDTKQMGMPLSETKSVKNLGLFLAQFERKFDDMVFLIFKFYSGLRKWSEKRNFYLRLVKEIQKSRKHRKKAYLKKIFRECSAFVCKKDLRNYMICDRNYYTSAMIQFISDPDAVIKKSRILKEGNSSTVAIIKQDNRPMVVKRYNIKNVCHALSRCFRPTRASISWKNANQLLFSGILTPMPVMFLEKRYGPFRSTAYFLMEYVDGIDGYNLFHSDRLENSNLKNMANKFTEILQKFADASLSHNDFKATNFILAHDGSLYILDLDGMCECRFGWLLRRSFKKNCRRLMKNWTDLPEVSQIFKEQIAKLKL